jgi:heme/copper-type cytochrome/quinol oxidase subunit 4
MYYFDSITVPCVESLTAVNLFQFVQISFSLNAQDLHMSRRRTAHNVMWKFLVTIYFCVIVFIKILM